jgi:flagellin
MSLNISTNTAALKAGSYLAQNSLKLQKAYDRLASGRKLSSPMDNPGGLAVSMKLQAAINRLGGAQNNVQNALSFLEVQDGMLDSVGKIVDRMSELKGLASQDPMKSDRDRASYNNEFKDLQVQLYDISQMKFNGVSLFARHASADNGTTGTNGEALFGGESQFTALDNTLTIYTSEEGAAGSKVSVHKSLLLSALTMETFQTNGSYRSSIYSVASSTTAIATGVAQSTATFKNHADPTTFPNYSTMDGQVRGNSVGNGNESTKFVATFASASGGELLDLQDISVGVITQALENIAFLRSQNGGVQSRLTFNLNSISSQKTNMRAALGRVVDVDIAEETTNLAKYSILQQSAASILAQANQSTDIALMLLR